MPATGRRSLQTGGRPLPAACSTTRRTGSGSPPPSLTVTQTSQRVAYQNYVPVSVHADASASSATDLPIASYSFDFGDGSPAVGPQAEPTADHTYWMPATRPVTVTVTDSDGRWSTAQQSSSFVSNGFYMSNSSFETGTSGWNTVGSGAGVTLTQVPGGHSGAFAVRVANEGTSAGTCALNDTPNQGSLSAD